MTWVKFTESDPMGLWHKGDLAEDLGWESTEEVGVRLLRTRRYDEVLSLQDPWRRGLIEPAQIRYAVVKRNRMCDSTRVLERYLPDNYWVARTLEDAFIVEGEDSCGWTMDAYVIPRLASGLIVAREIDREEGERWVR